ncbi:hypothetical protein PARHAE_00994 [Paracoccus haematequi]|uniref:VPLPA-CTERM protein sorting domain-containing protein n=1 Tax=Paracoccus haematequi TaxID=2491866 RepID=A0A3S4CXB3_9RHOB|nr:hypothetical protein [Paracoccus haematequi]VDS07816.1 hypothetical protein PARHAE_00994 [Paracoccus haematequi]
MRSALQAVALAFATTFTLGSVADAATVASVDVPLRHFGGIIYEIQQAGRYTLDFSGTGSIEGLPDYLGFAGYVLAEVTGLEELLELLDDGVTFTAINGLSFDLGFFEAGTDFAAGIATLGGDATMSLVRIDDEPAPVPLPASLPLLAAAVGITGLAARRRIGA